MFTSIEISCQSDVILVLTVRIHCPVCRLCESMSPRNGDLHRRFSTAGTVRAASAWSFGDGVAMTVPCIDVIKMQA